MDFSVLWQAILDILQKSGFTYFFTATNEAGEYVGWMNLVMILVSFVLLYLAIKKQFEPLLLLPIAFGMLLTNLPNANMFHPEVFIGDEVHSIGEMLNDLVNIPGGAGLLDYLYLGVKLGIYPPLIFLGIGCMTDFGPLISNPKSLLLGAAAQFGIFVTFAGASALGFTAQEAASIGIIGGADGPTAIFLTSKLAPHLLGAIAIAAYSYMALIPIIQPPIMKVLTTKRERQIVMKELRQVSRTEKIIFPIMVTAICVLLLPDAAPLIGCLMLGNLFKECGVVDRIWKTAQNELMNIVTIFLGITVGATANGQNFLKMETLMIVGLGLIAFAFSTAGGVLIAKLMNALSGGNSINPLIGSAGVSAVPMAARVSQVVGQQENPSNFLLMHAMGPNVAGVIGSAVAAGVLLTLFG
ncbi:MAG: sodium ion-translocating decarboxylase subunit beta [Clostridia bacterium]|nr:sodium ion-translocating decarboxylase subunit beta [Clostridia bacterium]